MDAARAQQAWPGLATMGASKKHKLYSGLDNGLKTGDISLSILQSMECAHKNEHVQGLPNWMVIIFIYSSERNKMTGSRL